MSSNSPPWKVRAVGNRNGSDRWRGHVLPSSTAPDSRKVTAAAYVRDIGGNAPGPGLEEDAHVLSSGGDDCRPPCALIDANTSHGSLSCATTSGTMDQHGTAGRGAVTEQQVMRRLN